MAKNSGPNFFWDKLVPTIYSAGAAVVILGALAKIQHWDFGGPLLTAGLGTEVLIFLLYALQTLTQSSDREPDWTRVYPELDDNYNGPAITRGSTSSSGVTAKLDNMLDNAKLGPEVFDSLGKGFRNLSETVGKISDLTDATVATNDYARNVKSASTAINDMNKSYGVAISAMSSMADATKDAQSYREQFQQITKNMGALNAVYELELQDTTKHLKAMNAFYGNLTAAMENMADATKESQVFKNEMSKLTTNISSLNGIYGNMLTAMRGGNA
ncbi:type IX secretion system motor protein PorL/GldL [Dyadobacter fanqingshengii]|uniref:Gliding motility protein GldL n=1 Tax=Dyadobacter fanqingshengii TaxID=2906443 RepID=A0A9X1PDQ3_9BACT|nr:gliding motility protein GldL [Dyadobacter fanqingshengii]MCF0043176.1 gliding motility protein GldL [Dyadobacter fanqingshengii]MCF0043254.1 gliding motility protein GldL [Dyadobacter fanqingshengii]MCF2506730.1 gliding motility protein GldL [Dyadobacter fanqingshengii]USJ35728.1 gliding motility protein GldL [Dyadobacter fanqingshengii]